MLFSHDPEVNRSKLYRYLDIFCRTNRFPHGSIEVSQERMDALAVALSDDDELRERMSPFKIAGIFSVEFVRHRPVLTPFPHAALSQFDPNSVFAYFYSVDGLVNATIQVQGITRRIPQRIMVSKHFFSEFTRALSQCRTRRDALLCALVYESLCYQFNEIYYPRIL